MPHLFDYLKKFHEDWDMACISSCQKSFVINHWATSEGFTAIHEGFLQQIDLNVKQVTYICVIRLYFLFYWRIWGMN
jgi:hypothetical protein